MEVQLTPDQEAFVRQAIESGRLRREEDAVREDLRPGLRSFSVDNHLIIHRVVEDDVVLILHVVHGRRNIGRLLGH
jgi:plasmid stabilization system protein ParE